MKYIIVFIFIGSLIAVVSVDYTPQKEYHPDYQYQENPWHCDNDEIQV